MCKRVRFTKEFKQDAVELAVDRAYPVNELKRRWAARMRYLSGLMI